MELRPGVFFSNTEPEDWESDPDVPGSEMHVLVDADGVMAGLTRIQRADAPMPFTPPAREVFLVLEGSVRIEMDGGDALELAVGDMATLPAGVPTIWHVTAPYKELWVIA